MAVRISSGLLWNAAMAMACLALAGCPAEESASSREPPSNVPANQAPAAPTSVVATAGNAQVSVSWAASSGATSYQVKRATTGAGPYGQIGTATATSYMDTNVVNGTAYFYVVAATSAAGASSDSAAASATPVDTTPTPPAPPPPPPPAPPTPPVTTAPITSLPVVSTLSNVQVAMNGGRATITFDPVDDARDYRVYALPSNDNIQLASDGSVVIQNAIYRCAGTLHTPAVKRDDEAVQDHGINTRVASTVNGYTRTLGEATLGYVYTTADAVAGLVPVYVVGNPDIESDNEYFYRYQASRDKKYTTSATEYATLVAAGWRDDGIAFYVPGTASAGTKPVLTNTSLSDTGTSPRYYLNQGAELTARGAGGFSTAFNVLTAAAPGAKPLMRVFYQNCCGRSRDELAVGQANFTRIRNQGLGNPATTLHYSGITSSKTLVVEALDRSCPFQGNISSHSVAAQTISFGTYSIAHSAWSTIPELQGRVTNGEVFINGQSDTVVGKPKAIARAYVTLSPATRPQMDWMSTPASFSEAFTVIPCGSPDGNCFQQFRQQSATYDMQFMSAETNHWTVGNVEGELLVNYADWAADTNGKFRATVRTQKATIASNSFMHATMEVNAVGSARRYPQMIISDQNAPVQFNLINGRSLVLQTFADFPSRLDLEICDHVTWEVNAQCPRYIFRHKRNSAGAITGINPIPESDQFLAAVDAATKFDLYASSTRAYVFVNGKPYGCANLASKTGVSPIPVAPTGQVTVTFGDALYHSSADDNFNVKMPGSFISRRFGVSTSRHYDNLGFSSGVSAPAWDETKFPCSTVMTMSDSDPAR
jgi:hypothetical protein